MTIDFVAAYHALTGRPSPFRWQQRLFDRLVEGKRYAACDIPTGLGKTSVMAIWLAALARGAPGLPRRLVYVVDRRAVVDQATQEADQLARALDKTDESIIALRRGLGLEEGQGLPVSTLRGQYADNRAWLDDPSLPAIVVGTVDMIGSRLLFQGYGVSARMRPVHAALLGTDALIVLDEAHLVPPFQALVEQVVEVSASDRSNAPFCLPELRLMTLSATGRGAGHGDGTFKLEPEDEERDDVVRRRLNAPKWLALEAPPSADLATLMADRAWERAQDGGRVVVFCDRRKVAEAVCKDLSQRLRKLPKERFGVGSPKAAELIELMVGARRVHEREALAASRAFRRFSPPTAKAEADRAAGLPAFLVATSAGEVGVDVDADHMVCDLVAWERMVQRLGRVNRLGEFGPESLIDVFAVPSDKDAEAPADDARIKQLRAPFDAAAWAVREDGRRLASPGALRKLRSDETFAALAAKATTPAPLRPALTSALIDAWSMTSLAEHPGRPKAGPWIRGWVEEEPQTQVLWRRYLPVRPFDSRQVAEKELEKFFEAAPPHLTEILETTTFSIVEMMRARAKALLRKAGDVETPAAEDDVEVDEAQPEEEAAIAAAPLFERTVVAVVLAPDRSVERLLRLGDINNQDVKRLHAAIAGRIVVLDARMGGLAGTGLLDGKEGQLPETLDGEPLAEAPARPADGEEGRPDHPGWGDERLQEIGFRVGTAPHETEYGQWKVSYRRFVDARAEEADDPAQSTEWRVEEWVGGDPAQSETALTRNKQDIDRHHVLTRQRAERIARRLALPADASRMLMVAAVVHDWGKARPNWQAYAGNPGFARGRTKPLAKFTTRGNPNLLKIGDVTYRHEFGSLADALASPEMDAISSPDLRELALHLIAAHHGNARPVIAAVDQCASSPEESVVLAQQAARRFMALQGRWGAWGLAWWEALLRAADVAASREVDEDCLLDLPAGEDEEAA